MTLDESSLLRSLSAASRYSARDIADLLFLYMTGLHILRCDFEAAPFAQNYARKTISYNNWDQIRINSTDLYQLINILVEQSNQWTLHLKNQSSSRLLLQDISIDPHDIRQFLQNIAQGGFNSIKSGRLLLRFEQDLKISVTNYKSIRRIAADWELSHVDTEAKSLVVTRLLQAIRHRAFSGDLIHELTEMGHRQDLIIHGACDPETGKNCSEPAPTVSHATPTPKGPSLLKQLAIGAGLGVGAYILGKAMFGGRSHK